MLTEILFSDSSKKINYSSNNCCNFEYYKRHQRFYIPTHSSNIC